MSTNPPTELEETINERIDDGRANARTGTNEQRDEPGGDTSVHDNRAGSLSRRSVLGTVSASAATAATMSGSAAAASGPRSLSEAQQLEEAKNVLPTEYAKLDLPAKVGGEASDVLEALHEEDLIDEPSLAAFDGFGDETLEAVDHHDGGVAMTVSWESVRGAPAAELFARAETEFGEVRLHHTPTLDVEPAATLFEDGERVGRVTADGTLHEFGSGTLADTGSCDQCYKTCDPVPEIRGNYPGEDWCGGCNPGGSCNSGGGGW